MEKLYTSFYQNIVFKTGKTYRKEKKGKTSSTWKVCFLRSNIEKWIFNMSLFFERYSPTVSFSW